MAETIRLSFKIVTFTLLLFLVAGCATSNPYKKLYGVLDDTSRSSVITDKFKHVSLERHTTEALLQLPLKKGNARVLGKCKEVLAENLRVSISVDSVNGVNGITYDRNVRLRKLIFKKYQKLHGVDYDFANVSAYDFKPKKASQYVWMRGFVFKGDALASIGGIFTADFQPGGIYQIECETQLNENFWDADTVEVEFYLLNLLTGQRKRMKKIS